MTVRRHAREVQTLARTHWWRRRRPFGLGHLLMRSLTRTERNGAYEALVDAYHHLDVLRLGVCCGRGLASVPHTRERTQELPALRLARYACALRVRCLVRAPISAGLADARLAELHPLRERHRACLLRPGR